MENIVILGSGGFAKEVAFLIEEINIINKKWNVLGFVGGSEKEVNKSKYRVIGNDDWLKNINVKTSVAIGIGEPSLLKKIIQNLNSAKNSHLIFPNLIHPSVIYDSPRVSLGQGNIICAGTIMTTDISIGNFNIFNLSCTLGHDAKIGNYNVLNPTVNISGGVNIQDGCLIGTGAQVLQYKRLVNNVIVGAGAVVTKDLSEPGVYVGTPAIKMK